MGCLVLAGPGAERLTAGDVAAARDFGDLAALAVHRLQTDRLRDEQKAHVESLLHAGRSITSSLVLQDVLDAVAREVVDTLGAGYCVIWEFVEDEDLLLERAGYGTDEGFGIDGEVVLLAERPREREILFSSEPVIETLSDPQLDADSRESMERWGEKTCLSLPLRFGEMTIGVLVVCETERERRFTSAELELAAGLANQASAAVHNARIYRDLERRNEELTAGARRERLLNELSFELGSSLDPRTVLDSACRDIAALLDAGTCGMYAQRDGGVRRMPRRLGGRRGRPRRRRLGRPAIPARAVDGHAHGGRQRRDRGRRRAGRSAPGGRRARGHGALGPAGAARDAHAGARPRPGDAWRSRGRPGRARSGPMTSRRPRRARAWRRWPSTTPCCSSARPTTPSA